MNGKFHYPRMAHKLQRVMSFLVILVMTLVTLLANTVLAASVIPSLIPGADNQNKTCEDVFPDIEDILEFKIEPVPDGNYSEDDAVITTGIVKPSTLEGSLNSFDWTSNIAVLGVVVKDGVDGAYFYDYSADPQTADMFLTTPNDGDKEISHISFCYLETEKVSVSVTACKLEDVDADPETNDDQVPVENWDVYLSIDGERQTPGAKTGADGCYTWSDLEPGPSYGVEEDVPTDWYAWTATMKTFGPAVSGGEYEYTFINSEKVRVTACKLEDVDKMAKSQADQVPVVNWDVYLSIDGVWQTTGAKTGADGCYTWTNLDPGPSYGVKEIVPADWYAWTATMKIFGPSVSGGEYEFTFINSKIEKVLEKVNVTACKLEDLDADPETKDDQVPVENWDVHLSIDGVWQTVPKTSTKTGADGCYTWTDLEPGPTYGVKEDVPAEWYAWTLTEFDFGPSVLGGEYEYTFINSKIDALDVQQIDYYVYLPLVNR